MLARVCGRVVVTTVAAWGAALTIAYGGLAARKAQISLAPVGPQEGEGEVCTLSLLNTVDAILQIVAPWCTSTGDLDPALLYASSTEMTRLFRDNSDLYRAGIKHMQNWLHLPFSKLCT